MLETQYSSIGLILMDGGSVPMVASLGISREITLRYIRYNVRNLNVIFTGRLSWKPQYLLVPRAIS